MAKKQPKPSAGEIAGTIWVISMYMVGLSVTAKRVGRWAGEYFAKRSLAKEQKEAEATQ